MMVGTTSTGKHSTAYRSSALRAALVALFFSAAISSAFCQLNRNKIKYTDCSGQHPGKVGLTSVSALIRSTRSVYSSVKGSFDFSGLSALSPMNFSYLHTVLLPIQPVACNEIAVAGFDSKCNKGVPTFLL